MSKAEYAKKSYPEYETQEEDVVVDLSNPDVVEALDNMDLVDTIDKGNEEQVEEQENRGFDDLTYDGLFQDQEAFQNAPIIQTLPEANLKYREITLRHERYYREHPSKLYVPRLRKDVQLSREEFDRLFVRRGQPVITPFESLRHLNFTMKPWTLEELQKVYPNTVPTQYKYGENIDLGPAIYAISQDTKLRKTKYGRSFPRKLQFTERALSKIGMQDPPYLKGSHHMLGALWFASTADTTPSHSDCCDNFATMIAGTKRWIVGPPNDSRVLKPYKCAGGLCWSSLVHPENPKTLQEKTIAQKAQTFKFDLNPGEILYLPAGWFHHVQNMQPTVMANYWLKGGPRAFTRPQTSFE
eukprot:CAMPEP_0203767966 /NCGR_PEP_ID=MMETSP0099_2-20121227/1306_1 /ASSEMBLY_ACC=CAM_ASM_000209 /TAXON_ID=96639 /ORGANISM=" , Strain NY0313808BC1" /LENGTH=354 /DNA_ID=CAMNT_0050664565 /DNA_START=348 /DNA_END=1409 /DNA_ORIENTATION=-